MRAGIAIALRPAVASMNLAQGFRAALRLLAGGAGLAVALYGACLGVGSLRHARVTRLGRAW
jgi:hypothetical protein